MWRIAGSVLAALLVLGALWWVASRAGMIPAWLTNKEHVMARKLGWMGAARQSAAAIALALPSLGAAAPGDAGPVPPTTIGINPTTPQWYYGRVFTNLALGGSSWRLGGQGVKAFTATDEMVDANGYLKSLPTGTSAYWSLTRLTTGPKGTVIRCTYAGKGDMTPLGATRGDLLNLQKRPNLITFTWINTEAGTNPIRLRIDAIDPADPIRDIDCREESRPPEQRYDPAFVRLMQHFKVLRFMGWEGNNSNQPVTWATRHTPHSFDIRTKDQVSIEDIVALTKMTHADPWLNMPWNADDDYIYHIAKYVHDNVPADRHIYVELSNEVWNMRFDASKQAMREGQERHLSQKPGEAMLFRYAQRTVETMKIWEKVFADRPSQLVRVIATQHVAPASAETVLGYADTAKHVDALATAPYFGGELRKVDPMTDLDTIFARLTGMVDQTIDQAVRNKAVARRYGKRYISYESGQGIVIPKDVPLEEKIQRDPRMYDLTKRFIQGWKTRVGDTLMVFGSVFPIGRSGAWGLLEYDGQPPSEAPKYRAVMEEIGR